MYLTAVLLLMNQAKYSQKCWADKEMLRNLHVHINRFVLRVNQTEADWNHSAPLKKKNENTSTQGRALPIAIMRKLLS